MKPTVLLLAFALATFLSSCSGNNQQETEAISTTQIVDSNNLQEEQMPTPVSNKPQLKSIGLDLFDIDTVSQIQFDQVFSSYKNPFLRDTTYIKKRHKTLFIPLADEAITFTDHENPEDETDVMIYNFQGRLKEQFYYVTVGYYEGYDGFLIQPESNKVDTISSDPLVSSNEQSFISPIDEYGSIGTSGFTYYNKEDNTFNRTATVIYNDGTILEKLAWDDKGDLYIQSYDAEHHDEKENYFVYLKFTKK